MGIADKFRFDPTDPTESLTMIGPDRACITIRVGLPHLWVLNFSPSRIVGLVDGQPDSRKAPSEDLKGRGLQMA